MMALRTMALFAFCLLAPVFSPVASAQVAEIGLTLDSTQTQATGHARTLAHSLLWKISRPGIDHASYLFGTVHIVPESRFTVADRVRDALQEADRIVFEFNMGDEDFAKNASRETRLEAGMTLQDLYGEERFATLSALVKEAYGFDFTMLGAMKPFYLIAIFSTNLIGEPVTSYERYLYEYALENGVAIGGLEDVQRQFEVVNTIPLEEQAEMLAELIEDPAQAKEMFRDMYDAYGAEDLARIHKFVLESPEMEKYYDIFLVDRNRAWISAITKHHEEGRSFIACGAAHFAGPDGLIRLLRDAGFAVEPE